MQELNRAIQPQTYPIENIDFIQAKKKVLANGIPLYYLNAGDQDVIKIDFIFEAGTKYQNSPLIATTTNKLLSEGTKSYTSAQIAEKLDFYGAFLHQTADRDFASITMYSLTKHFSDVSEILEEIIKHPTFPQKELDNYLIKQKQKFIVDSSKVKSLSQRKFTNVIFGENHPYGTTAKLEDFKNVKQKQLLDFFNRLYSVDNLKIVISGKIDNNIISMIENKFSDNWNNSIKVEIDTEIASNITDKVILVEKKDAVQSAIRMGKLLFNKLHPDYFGMTVLNTIFGGYFGSRLMTNIREDKGYTYGIGSGIVSLKDAGFFTIVSEVGSDVCRNAIDEVYIELEKIRTEIISEDELNTVKNYMLGEIIRTFDGPFAMSDSFISLLEYDLSYDYITKYIKTIKNIKAEELNKLANKYFNKADFLEIVAGKC